jgi:glutamate synthase (NADPH/NADH) small chain
VASSPESALPAERLETRFADKNPPLTRAEAAEAAARCLYCYDAPCIRACPTSIDIPVFIRQIATRNPRGAARTILRSNLLGASCARVCPVEVLCEGSCVYTNDGRPAVPIGRLQRYAMDQGAAVDLLERRQPTGRSIGCVGAGPASLACAGTAALLGHQAVVYEKNDLPGGLNTTGVAPYKFRADDALLEVDFIRALGVEIKTGVRVGKDLTAKQLLERHDAVFLGVGLGTDSRLGVPGEDGPGVAGAVEWIEWMKTDPSAKVDGIRRAAVIGGGNTAVDAVRELRGLGVAEVTCVVRRPAGEMKAYDHEVEAARKEGAVIVDRAAVREIVREKGRIQALRLVETEDGKPTDREKALLPAELVLLAIGQSKLGTLARSFPGVECDKQGRIVADPATLRTGNPRVYAGGDALNGGKEVVNAVHDGQLAARSIHAALAAGEIRRG